MSDAEYDSWDIHSRLNYAAEKEKEGLSPEDARAESEKSFARHLPQGKNTQDQHIYAVTRAESGEVAGHLWWGMRNHGSKKIPWIFDIELRAEFRGQGLGRATMELAQADVKAKGFDRLGLHVFGHNKVARALYESIGFETLNVVMVKELKD